jgi:lysophospholipase L1-like esterase
MLRIRLTACLLALSFCVTGVLRADDPPATPEAQPPAHSAITPVPREGGWIDRHEKINERAKQGDADLLFIGDSITEGWEGAGKDVWQQHYGNRKAMNLGIGGDRTQHVLWRLDNGNIEGLHPKLAVIMIGTNNSNRDDNTADEIADGIKAIVAKLRERLPEMKILLLGVFPRGETHNPQREKIARFNELARQVADGQAVRYLDIKEKFLNEDGSISKEIMPDYLHLSPQGYEIWASSIEERVAELLGEK